MTENFEGIKEIKGTFKITKMSPTFHKMLFGDYPEVSTPEEANIYGLTRRELEKEK